ncbi:MAG TPA: hypothetical protein DEH05_12125 [Propionibacteriaceae bacterium]|nr:hypothetical protein [Propionibacteriaceae bacterium]
MNDGPTLTVGLIGIGWILAFSAGWVHRSSVFGPNPPSEVTKRSPEERVRWTGFSGRNSSGAVTVGPTTKGLRWHWRLIPAYGGFVLALVCALHLLRWAPFTELAKGLLAPGAVLAGMAGLLSYVGALKNGTSWDFTLKKRTSTVALILGGVMLIGGAVIGLTQGTVAPGSPVIALVVAFLPFFVALLARPLFDLAPDQPSPR